MIKAKRVSRSGIAKITRALAAGFRPGNGYVGPGAYMRKRKAKSAQLTLNFT